LVPLAFAFAKLSLYPLAWQREALASLMHRAKAHPLLPLVFTRGWGKNRKKTGACRQRAKAHPLPKKRRPSPNPQPTLPFSFALLWRAKGEANLWCIGGIKDWLLLAPSLWPLPLPLRRSGAKALASLMHRLPQRNIRRM
jgi:hypothetical protein